MLGNTLIGFLDERWKIHTILMSVGYMKPVVFTSAQHDRESIYTGVKLF